MGEPANTIAALVREWAVWLAVRQGLQREYLAALLWAHGNAVGNRTSQIRPISRAWRTY